MNIGIMVGSFNPPHLAHLEFLKTAKAEAKLDEIWMAPVPLNPLKKGKSHLPLGVRVNLCRLLVKNDHWIKIYDPNFSHRNISNEMSYLSFVDLMISDIKEIYTGLSINSYGLCGKDTYRIFSFIMTMLRFSPNFVFQDMRKILSGTTFIIGPRGRRIFSKNMKVKGGLVEFKIGRNFSPVEVIFLSTEDTMLLSSKSIRASLANGDRNVRGLTTDVERAYLAALSSN